MGNRTSWMSLGLTIVRHGRKSSPGISTYTHN
uniref:Uncharacterized protein n=1 Tax=Anguilla anguilla TaxID=7936 RepID=A0A0E9UVT3_ANGAN